MLRIISSLMASIAVLASAAVQAAPPVEIATNAPDSYTVVKGDTLWGISGRFLQKPWRWPEVWEMNEDEIKNPHLIYPGQIVYLDRNGPRLRLGNRIGSGGAVGQGRIEPRAYETPIDEAISTIPLKSIAPFLQRPLVVDKAVKNPATIVATETSRVYLAKGDTIFAKNVKKGVKNWSIFRTGKPLVDPITNKNLGVEVQYLGAAKVVKRTSPVTLEITDAVQEIGTGDLMLPLEDDLVFSYVPHAPKAKVDAHLVSIYRGVQETGRLSVVAVSAGRADGMEPGHAVALYRNRGTAIYKEGNKKETYKLPEKRYGSALIFRVFEHVSYALIMDTDGQATVGDTIRNP